MPRPKKALKHSHISVDNDTEEPLEVIVSSIHKLAEGFDKILDSGLTEYTLVLLLHDATKVNKGDIKKILAAAPFLAERYTRPNFDKTEGLD